MTRTAPLIAAFLIVLAVPGEDDQERGDQRCGAGHGGSSGWDILSA